MNTQIECDERGVLSFASRVSEVDKKVLGMFWRNPMILNHGRRNYLSLDILFYHGKIRKCLMEVSTLYSGC